MIKDIICRQSFSYDTQPSGLSRPSFPEIGTIELERPEATLPNTMLESDRLRKGHS